MSLHPELAPFVKGWDVQITNYRDGTTEVEYIISPAELTAFALAVARAERDRRGLVLRILHNEKFG